MYNIDSNIVDLGNEKIRTFGRNIRNGVLEYRVEAGVGNNSALFKVVNKNPQHNPMMVRPIGVNGSEGFEVIIGTQYGLNMIIIALKFIRRVLLDYIRGKIF
jgi:hypothetical protein